APCPRSRCASGFSGFRFLGTSGFRFLGLPASRRRDFRRKSSRRTDSPLAALHLTLPRLILAPALCPTASHTSRFPADARCGCNPRGRHTPTDRGCVDEGARRDPLWGEPVPPHLSVTRSVTSLRGARRPAGSSGLLVLEDLVDETVFLRLDRAHVEVALDVPDDVVPVLAGGRHQDVRDHVLHVPDLARLDLDV